MQDQHSPDFLAMNQRWIPITETLSNNLGILLNYPAKQEGTIRQRIDELMEAGVSHLRLSGSSKIFGLTVLGKGKTSIVVECKWKGMVAALKLMRSDSPLKDFDFESRITKKANDVGVGPTLYKAYDKFIIMELIKGVPLQFWLKEKYPDRRPEIIRSILQQAWQLDSVGIRHNELSNPSKHIIVTDARPVIIDFGSSTLGSRGHNLAAAFQYIFLRGTFGNSVEKDKAKMLEALRVYRNNPGYEEFETLLHLVSSFFQG